MNFAIGVVWQIFIVDNVIIYYINIEKKQIKILIPTLYKLLNNIKLW